MYDFLLVINSNFGRIYCFRDKAKKSLNFPTHFSLRPPFGGNPLEFGDEIWHQKTRIMGLSEGEEIMTLAFFVLTQYRRVTGGQTDRQTRYDPCYPR